MPRSLSGWLATRLAMDVTGRVVDMELTDDDSVGDACLGQQKCQAEDSDDPLCVLEKGENTVDCHAHGSSSHQARSHSRRCGKV